MKRAGANHGRKQWQVFGRRRMRGLVLYCRNPGDEIPPKPLEWDRK